MARVLCSSYIKMQFVAKYCHSCSITQVFLVGRVIAIDTWDEGKRFNTTVFPALIYILEMLWVHVHPKINQISHFGPTSHVGISQTPSSNLDELQIN